jgi:acetylornithine deacetylase/succinyl-diaminopimelate desuccinylase-like protein
MKPLIRNKLFNYIDEHIITNWEQWQKLQNIIETAFDSCTQQNLQAILVALLQESGINIQVVGLPQIAIYGLSSGESPQILLFYLPVYRSHHLAPLIYSLAAVKAYQATVGHIPISIKWLLDFGEGEQLATIVARDQALLQANGCLWYSEEQGRETGPQFALGSKGQLSVELSICTGSLSAPTIHAGVLPNALWRLLWAVNSLKSVHEEILIEGFYDPVKPLADDSTALLCELHDNTRSFAQHWGVEEPLLGLHGRQFHYAHLLTPTCTISNITDNTQTTKSTTDIHATIPTLATARLEFLLVPEQDPHDIFDKLRSHLQTQGFADIDVRLLHGNQPTYTELKHPFVQAVSQSSSYVYKRPPYILPLSAGSYPLAPLRSTLNMPVILDLMSTPTEGMDASDITRHMAQQIKQLVLIMDKFTQIE